MTLKDAAEADWAENIRDAIAGMKSSSDSSSAAAALLQAERCWNVLGEQPTPFHLIDLADFITAIAAAMKCCGSESGQRSAAFLLARVFSSPNLPDRLGDTARSILGKLLRWVGTVGDRKVVSVAVKETLNKTLPALERTGLRPTATIVLPPSEEGRPPLAPLSQSTIEALNAAGDSERLPFPVSLATPSYFTEAATPTTSSSRRPHEPSLAAASARFASEALDLSARPGPSTSEDETSSSAPEFPAVFICDYCDDLFFTRWELGRHLGKKSHKAHYGHK